jgi:hypothetical protein
MISCAQRSISRNFQGVGAAVLRPKQLIARNSTFLTYFYSVSYKIIDIKESNSRFFSSTGGIGAPVSRKKGRADSQTHHGKNYVT